MSKTGQLVLSIDELDDELDESDERDELDELEELDELDGPGEGFSGAGGGVSWAAEGCFLKGMDFLEDINYS